MKTDFVEIFKKLETYEWLNYSIDCDFTQFFQNLTYLIIWLYIFFKRFGNMRLSLPIFNRLFLVPFPGSFGDFIEIKSWCKQKDR